MHRWNCGKNSPVSGTTNALQKRFLLILQHTGQQAERWIYKLILFDTDTCIHLLRGNQNIIKKRQKYTDQMAISFMTVAELFYGAEKSG